MQKENIRLVYLLPPSEGKISGGVTGDIKRSFNFDIPHAIASQATPKDLKCTDKRYEEGIALNTTINQGPVLPAIQRYNGVMYKAIDYQGMDAQTQQYFDESVMICSGMYGLLRPQDCIANYKLPIDTKGLRSYRGSTITDILNTLPNCQIIDLLPGSYKKMIQRSDIKHAVLHGDYFQDGKKLTHAVKGVKGRRLSDECARRAKSHELGTEKYTEGTVHYTDKKLGTIEVVFST